jgi:prepilin-type processing-associated H-X9-DG protein
MFLVNSPISSHTSAKPRSAATLIELLAVLSILGSLATLLLPAIQKSRESARATGCRSNLREIGSALASYESLQRHFPMGAQARYDRLLSPVVTYGFSWWAEILSHFDESNIADQLDRRSPNVGWAYVNAQNGELADGYGPGLWFCYSSPVDRFVKSGDFQIAAPSYSGISGATRHDGFPEIRVNRCCRSEGEISAGGVLVPNTVIYVRQVTDGLANTLLVGEQSDFVYTEAGEPMKIGAAFVKGWLAGTVTLGTPPKYLDWLAPAHNLATVRYRLNERRYELPGIYIDIGANNPLLSPHPQVVNLLFCDGSVRAVNESIEVNVLKSLATRDDCALVESRSL